MQKNELNLLERIKAPTPRFFRKVQVIGLLMGGISGAILTAPVVLPAALVGAAGYLAVAAGVLTTISQTAVCKEEKRGKE